MTDVLPNISQNENKQMKKSRQGGKFQISFCFLKKVYMR